jgi:hypothetical protein
MIIHVKEKTDKCNHVQQLKHENKVPRNSMAIKILISSAIKKNLEHIKKDCIKYEKWLEIKIISYI